MTYQNLGDAQKKVLRGKIITINTYLTENISYKQPNFTSQGTRKSRTIKPQHQ